MDFKLTKNRKWKTSNVDLVSCREIIKEKEQTQSHNTNRIIENKWNIVKLKNQIENSHNLPSELVYQLRRQLSFYKQDYSESVQESRNIATEMSALRDCYEWLTGKRKKKLDTNENLRSPIGGAGARMMSFRTNDFGKTKCTNSNSYENDEFIDPIRDTSHVLAVGTSFSPNYDEIKSGLSKTQDLIEKRSSNLGRKSSKREQQVFFNSIKYCLTKIRDRKATTKTSCTNYTVNRQKSPRNINRCSHFGKMNTIDENDSKIFKK